MWLRFHDCREQRGRCRTDLLGLAQQACRRPFRVTPMARRHVLWDRRVLVRKARARMARNPLSLVEDLDRALREPRIDGHHLRSIDPKYRTAGQYLVGTSSTVTVEVIGRPAIRRPLNGFKVGPND